MLRFNIIVPAPLLAILSMLFVILIAFGIDGVVVSVVPLLLLSAFTTST